MPRFHSQPGMPHPGLGTGALVAGLFMFEPLFGNPHGVRAFSKPTESISVVHPVLMTHLYSIKNLLMLFRCHHEQGSGYV